MKQSDSKPKDRICNTLRITTNTDLSYVISVRKSISLNILTFKRFQLMGTPTVLTQLYYRLSSSKLACQTI